MMPSGLSQNNSNRVKSITSKFEVLSEQTKCNENLKFQCVTTVPVNIKKVTVSKENVLQKSQISKVKSDLHKSQLNKSEINKNNDTFSSNSNSAKEKFGPSCYFGNRKRLKEDDVKETNESQSLNLKKEHFSKMELNHRSESKEDTKPKTLPNSTNFNSVDFEFRNDVFKDGLSKSDSQKSLTRQHSDPSKKLHRSPAFRCDRSEKIKDSRKNSFNSDSSDPPSRPIIENDRSKLSKDKLKKLGFLLEEKMRHDNFEFSKPKNKIKSNESGSSSEKSMNNDEERIKPLVYTDVSSGKITKGESVVTEVINDDLQIPQNILDQYAQVIKPKNRNAFVKKAIKSDAVFSDSGVSSESENLISDDLEDNEISPKLKNFKALRSNFETKNFTIQNREENSNRRKILKRSVEDKESAQFDQQTTSSIERLVDDTSENIQEKESGIFNKLNISDDTNKEIITSTVPEIQKENGLTDTLKKVLTQPLPPGPPPKKPPRTFASMNSNLESPTKSPDLDLENTKRKLKDVKGKFKQHRSKEESKLMLEKIENALFRYENSGKILSPRPVRKNDSVSENNDSDNSLNGSWTRNNTKPSTAKLKKSNKKDDSPKSSKEKIKDVHYMCTEILDIHFPENDNTLNSSNASLNSADSVQNSNSFTKCFNSLNCTNTSLRRSSGINYTRFGSSPNSARTSLTNVCCSCNFRSPRGSSSNALEDFNSPPTQKLRLSTFMPSPNKSIENLNNSPLKCDMCGNGEVNTDQFLCHINNPASECSENVNQSKSVFFVSRNSYNKNQESTSSQYGVLKKSKSQEHIYAEPFEIKRMNSQNKDVKSSRQDVPNRQSNNSLNLECKPPLLRTRTQLEDGFGKIREADFTKILLNPSLKNKSTSTFSPRNSLFEEDFPENDVSNYSSKSLNSFKGKNSDISQTKDICHRNIDKDIFHRNIEKDIEKQLNTFKSKSNEMKNRKFDKENEKLINLKNNNHEDNNQTKDNNQIYEVENLNYSDSLNSFKSKNSNKSEMKDDHRKNEMDNQKQTGSKVKDILMRLEGSRASLRIEKHKEDLKRKQSDSDSVFVISSDRNDSKTEDVFPVKNQSSLHYISTKIYDTPRSECSSTNSEDQNAATSTDIVPETLPTNTSFLYGHDRTQRPSLQQDGAPSLGGKIEKESGHVPGNNGSSIFKRPPLYERKPTLGSVKVRRPNSLYLTESRDPGRRRTAIEQRKRRSPTEVDKENLSRLMTEIYDTVAEACILEGNSVTPTSGETGHDTSDDVSLKLTRSLTEKRKRYVRRVSSRAGFLTANSTRVRRDPDSSAEDDAPADQDPPETNSYKTYPSHNPTRNASFLHSNNSAATEAREEVCTDRTGKEDVPSKRMDEKKEMLHKGGGLFEACVLVGMNFSTGQAYIKSIYPENAVIPPQIETLVFPESAPPNTDSATSPRKSRPMRISDESSDVQSYGLVLTNERGGRMYGYCRRVLPEGATYCLPLTYCIIAKHRAPAFYYKILQEIESHHGSSDVIVNSVLSQLYDAEFPRPGHSVTVKQLRSPKRIIIDSTFKKNSTYRNSVNLGDVLKSTDWSAGSSEDLNNGFVKSDSSQNLLKVDKDLDKFRRKSTDVSGKFPELYTKDSGISVMKSLEKIYGQDFKEFKSALRDVVSDGSTNHLPAGVSCFEREFGSSESNLDLENTPKEDLTPEDCPESDRNEEKSESDEGSMRMERSYSNRSSFLDVVNLKRPLEPRLDEDNLSVLFDSIGVSNLVKIFGTLLIERKVVIVCDKLSQLSSCLEALQSILYPMCWQHTLISCIPSELRRDILEAPIPILAGLLLPAASGQQAQELKLLEKINFEEGMLVDISQRDGSSEKIIKIQGDESTLLPPLLAKTLKASLQLGPPITASSNPSDEHARKTRNVLVAEAFLRFFVELLGDYKSFFSENPIGNTTDTITGRREKTAFQKEQYIRSFRSKHVQYFLEWFTETAMFCNFIQQRIHLASLEKPSFLNKEEPASDARSDLPYPDYYEVFDERLSRRGTSRSAVTLNSSGKESVTKGNYKMIVNKKVKVWRDKLRDLVN